MNPILLSISIPTYNRAFYLDRCLDSLLKQYKPAYQVEIIISDNCSTDHTEDIFKKYQSLNLPIAYIKNAENIGPDLNIAQAYYVAKGKYVLVFGDDDVFMESFFEQTMSLLSKNDYGLVFLNYFGFFKDSELKKRRINFFNAQYAYKYESILKIIRSRIGFVSASIVNSKYIDKNELIADAGTNLNHVCLILKAITNSDNNIYIGNYLIAQQEANSGGFNFFKIFGQNFYQVISSKLPGKYKAIGWIAKHFVVVFFVGGIIDFRKKFKNDPGQQPPLFFLRPHFDQYLLFWICNYPVAKLPYALALVYSYPIRVFAKLYKLLISVPAGKTIN